MDTDRLPDVHVQQLLPLGGEEEGEAKRGALVIIIVFERAIILIVIIVIERSISSTYLKVKFSCAEK